jgi:hypothetical protein
MPLIATNIIAAGTTAIITNRVVMPLDANAGSFTVIPPEVDFPCLSPHR